MCQTEATANAKALRQEETGHVLKTVEKARRRRGRGEKT